MSALSLAGRISLLGGMLALVLSIAVSHAQSVRPAQQDAVLTLVKRFGLVRGSLVSRTPEMREPGLLSMSDEEALQIARWAAVTLAGVSMLLALVTRYRREISLYPSVGFICGAMSLVFMDRHAALAALVLGMLALSVINKAVRKKASSS